MSREVPQSFVAQLLAQTSTGYKLGKRVVLVRAERRGSSAKVIEALADVIGDEGVPKHIRSDNRPEFVAKALHLRPNRSSKWTNGWGKVSHVDLPLR